MAISVLLLAIGTAIVFYILIGYPLILAFLTRRRAPAVRKDMSFRPKVSVLLAVHNGEDFIEKKLQTLLGLNYPPDLLEILVVSDGSTDSTDSIVQSFAGRGVRLLSVPRGGKPAALNAGLPHATGEILFFTDVRQAMPPDALQHLAANFADPTVGAVTGELRYVRGPGQTDKEADIEVYWRYELWVRRRHSQIDSACNATGCIYALRRSLAEPIPPDSLVDDAVIPLRAHMRGYRVIVEPKAIAYDYPNIKGGEFRRKMRTLAGLWQVHVRMPGLLSRANRMRFHFLSHKTARLALPWAILLVAGATIALPDSSFRNLLLMDEALFAALAGLDLIIPKGFPLKRVSSPARSFVTMNAAALFSVVVFFVPAEWIWRPTRLTQPAISLRDSGSV